MNENENQITVEDLKEELLHILQVQLSDTMKAAVLTPEGTYEKVDIRGKKQVLAQDVFTKEAKVAAQALKAQTGEKSRTFVPEEHVEI